MKMRMRRNKRKEMKRKLSSKTTWLKFKKKISHLVTLMKKMMMISQKNYLQSRVETIH